MRLPLAAFLLALCLLSGSAGAVEAVLGVEGQTGYNSNVFYQSTNVVSDGSLRMGPNITLRDQRGQLNWEISYRPSYEAYYTVHGINSVYQLGNGSLSWKPSAATEFYANDSFSYTPTRTSNFETNQPGLLATPGPVFANNFVTQNNGVVGLRHALAPRWLSELSISNSLANYQGSRYSNSMSTVAQAFATYVWSPTDQIGTGLGATRQTTEPPIGKTNGTNYYQLYGIWNHEFSPTWLLNINAGPTLVDPDKRDLVTTRQNAFLFARQVPTQSGSVLSPFDGGGCIPFNGILVAEGCPTLGGIGNPVDLSQTLVLDSNGQVVDLTQTGTLQQTGSSASSGGMNVTYFANVSMTKRWTWFDARVAYVRSASNNSGFAQSLITDSVTLTGDWNPSPLWELTVTGIFTRQQSDNQVTVLLTPVTGVPNLFAAGPQGVFFFDGAQAQGLRVFSQKSGLEVMNYGLSTQLNRRITRRTYVYGRASYEKQTTKRDIVGSYNTDRYIVTIGFRYEFDPIHILN